MELKIGVKAFLKNPEGLYLLMRRSEHEKRGTGKWDLPGGTLENEKSVLENLAREVLEETGLTQTSEPVFFDMQDILWPEGRHVIRLLYRGTIEGEPVLSYEHSEHKWFSVDEMIALSEAEFDSLLLKLVRTQHELLR
jgi:8-oxo-dGTP pyrophosphatase MutT (NUDIX family)